MNIRTIGKTLLIVLLITMVCYTAVEILVWFRLWTRTAGLMVELPLTPSVESGTAHGHVRLIVPAGSYITYLALRPSEHLDMENTNRVDAMPEIRVRVKVTNRAGESLISDERTIDIEQMLRMGLVDIAYDDVPFAPSPWAHLIEPGIALWPITSLWRAPEHFFYVEVKAEFLDGLPPLGEWTLRIERFVDAI